MNREETIYVVESLVIISKATDTCRSIVFEDLCSRMNHSDRCRVEARFIDEFGYTCCLPETEARQLA